MSENIIASDVRRLLALGEPGAQPAGAVIGVRTDRGSHVHCAGWAQMPSPSGDDGVPLSRELMIDQASVTKVAATTTMVMRLVADGLLCVDDRISQYLPGFSEGEKKRISIADVLTHSSGLRAWWPLYMEAQDAETAIEIAQRLPLAARPGETWCYSDLGLMLVGAVIEKVTSLSLREAYRALVAEPLGLASRFGPVAPTEAVAGADSDGYEYTMLVTGDPHPVPFPPEAFGRWRDGVVRGEVSDGNAMHAFGGAAGHAGLFSTVDDLLALGLALRGGDFIPEAVLRQFRAPQPIDPDQGLGFRRYELDVDGEKIALLGHSGFTGVWFGFSPDRELVIAGGAMRLHGTVGGLPTGPERPDGLIPIVLSTDIRDVMFDALAHAVRRSGDPLRAGIQR